MKLSAAQERALRDARQHAGRGPWFVFVSYPHVLEALERRGLVHHVRLPFRGSTQHTALLTDDGFAERRRLRRQP